MLSVEECNLNYVIPANYVDVNASNRINDVVSNNNIMCCNRHMLKVSVLLHLLLRVSMTSRIFAMIY